MPTGYTAPVEDGTITDLRTFVLLCARAMGACVMQRDDPMDDPPKRREPSAFEGQRVAEYRERLRFLNSLTSEDVKREAQREYDRKIAQYEEYAAKEREANARYNAMAEQVRAWQPPTAMHEEFKSFMLDQLRMSMHDYYTSPEHAPKRLSAEKWLEHEMSEARRMLTHYVKYEEEDRIRVAASNAWIDGLYASLETPVHA